MDTSQRIGPDPVGSSELRFSVRRLIGWYLAAVAALLALHLVALVGRHGFDLPRERGLVAMLHLDAEANLPTLFAVWLILNVAVVCAVLWRTAARDRRYWAGLAIVFTLLALDEFAAIHERFVEPVQERFDTSGLLYWAWVIPYAVGTLLLALVYSRWLIRLDRPLRTGFLLAGALYVGGAIVLEAVSGWYFEREGARDLGFDLISTLEELLELAGLLLFLYVALRLLADGVGLRRISFRH